MPHPEDLTASGAEVALAEQIRRLEERLQHTELRLAEAEQRIATTAEPGLPDRTEPDPAGARGPTAQPPVEAPATRWSRRALILGGAGAAAGIVHAANPMSPAAAAVGEPIVQGVGNNAGAAATALTAAATAAMPSWQSQPTEPQPVSLESTTLGIGVAGRTDTGAAVFGESLRSGSGIRGQARGTGAGGAFRSVSGPAIQLAPGDLQTFPTAGNWALGDVVNDTSGNVWLCVQGGSPGRWRLIGGPQSAGAYVPLTPTRVFDSRRSTPDNGRILTSAEPRVIGVGFARYLDTGAPISRLLPDGTRAIAANVTITDTSSARGFVALTPGDAADYQASAINWSSAGATIANGLILTADALLRLKAFVRGGDTHLIIDISGYFAQT